MQYHQDMQSPHRELPLKTMNKKALKYFIEQALQLNLSK